MIIPGLIVAIFAEWAAGIGRTSLLIIPQPQAGPDFLRRQHPGGEVDLGDLGLGQGVEVVAFLPNELQIVIAEAFTQRPVHQLLDPAHQRQKAFLQGLPSLDFWGGLRRGAVHGADQGLRADREGPAVLGTANANDLDDAGQPLVVIVLQTGILGLDKAFRDGRRDEAGMAALGGIALQQGVPIGLELADLIRASGTLPSV